MKRRVNLCVFPPVRMVAIKVIANPLSQILDLRFKVFYRLIDVVYQNLCVVNLEVLKGWVD